MLSVLFEPFDEMDLSEPYGAPPSSEYVAVAAQADDQLRRGGDGARAQLGRAPSSRATRRRWTTAIAGGRGRDHPLHRGRLRARRDRGRDRRTVEEFARRGVAYITLAHLFWRGVAQNAPAIPFVPDALYTAAVPERGNVGLTPLGEAAVRAMVEHHVLVDITHMNQKAIDHTFRLMDPRHAADRLAHRVPDRRHEYNLTDDAIREIGRRGGVHGRDRLRALGCDGLPHAQDVRTRASRSSARTSTASVASRGPTTTSRSARTSTATSSPRSQSLEHEGQDEGAPGRADRALRRGRARKKFCSDNVLDLLRRYWRGGDRPRQS